MKSVTIGMAGAGRATELHKQDIMPKYKNSMTLRRRLLEAKEQKKLFHSFKLFE